MSLDLIKEAVKVNQVIGGDTAQTIVENDIIVPDTKPDIARILHLDGEALVNSTDVVQDKVLVNGIIRHKILYIADDPEQPVKSINNSSTFRYTIDVPEARQGMKCKVRCDIKHMEYDILNSRKINIKAILGLDAKVFNELERNIVTDLEGVEDVQLLKTTARLNSYIGCTLESASVRETMEIPAGKPTIREILRNDIKITGKEHKVTDNKVIVKGELNVSTLYIGDDTERSIQFMEHEMPFTQFIDMSGLEEGDFCDVDLRVTDYSFEPGEDTDGELRVLKGEAGLDIFVEGYGTKEINLIEDAYSPFSRINLEKEPFVLENIITENRGQVTLKETIQIEEDSPDISEVFNIISKPTLSEIDILDERVVIEGVLENNILYLANNEEQPVNCHTREIPFRHTVDVKGIKPEMGCDVDMSVEHCSYSMVSAKEVEVRFVINITSKVFNEETLPVIVKVAEQPLEEKRAENQPSIVIYFAQQGDNLWKIAKRYYTTLDEIRKINSLGETDVISPGEQIIIPRKIK